jgi:hypothetical protein
MSGQPPTDEARHSPSLSAYEAQTPIAQRSKGQGKGSTPGRSRILQDGETAWVELRANAWCIIDASDIPIVANRKWHVWKKPRQCAYAYSTIRKADGCNSVIQMHRIITAAHTNLNVDHRDGDGLNNRRSNLRVCTPSQNSQNRKTRKDSKSGVKGVFWDSRREKYLAYIFVLGARKHLGYFTEKSEAARAYETAARTYFGDFARAS